MPCPINGMFLSKEAEEAKNELENDPDIVKESFGGIPRMGDHNFRGINHWAVQLFKCGGWHFGNK